MSSNTPGEPATEILRPPVPTPTASSTIVRAFFVQFFLALNCDRTRTEANTIAAKLNVDGAALYDLPESKLVDEFGYDGKIIYDALQRSKYGYYRMAIIGPSLQWLEEHLFSPAPSKDSWNSGGTKILEPLSSPSPVRSSLYYSPSSGCPAEAKLLSTQNGFQKGSRLGEGLEDDYEDDSIRFRRHYYQDIG